VQDDRATQSCRAHFRSALAVHLVYGRPHLPAHLLHRHQHHRKSESKCSGVNIDGRTFYDANRTSKVRLGSVFKYLQVLCGLAVVACLFSQNLIVERF